MKRLSGIMMVIMLISAASGLWAGGVNEVHLHGYGELHYNKTSLDDKDEKMDFHRMVIGLSYMFTEKIALDVEVDFEHAATELELEFAQISFLVSEELNFRVGSMLMPIGGLNEFHEPTGYYSVERPYVQKYVIPTSWSEGGAGVYGKLSETLNYRLYAVGGLDASGFTASSGIRGGRGKVAESTANDFAVAGRIEYSLLEGLGIGLSGYSGNAGQENEGLGDTGVTIAEADLSYSAGLFDFAGSYASVKIDDTMAIHELTGQVVGDQIVGWYAEAACHLGDLFLPEDQDLVLFVRREEFNTQDTVAAGLESDPANDRKITTLGVAYYPAPQVALKADVEDWNNAAGDDWTQANVGVAFIY